MKLISDVTFPSWPGISVNLNFRQCQSYRKMTNLVVAWNFIKKGGKNLYMHPKSFNIVFK